MDNDGISRCKLWEVEGGGGGGGGGGIIYVEFKF